LKVEIAAQGFPVAHYHLGNLYFNGNGVSQDYTHAFMWWSISVSKGYELAKKNLRRVEQMMTPSQIEKAQELARECVTKNYKGC